MCGTQQGAGEERKGAKNGWIATEMEEVTEYQGAMKRSNLELSEAPRSTLYSTKQQLYETYSSVELSVRTYSTR